MSKRYLPIILVLMVSVSAADDKVLLKGRYLNFVGGFNAPNVMLNNSALKWSSLGIDHLPGSNKWAIHHLAGHIVELFEPDTLGAPGDPWPEMTEGRNVPVFSSVDKMSPQGMFWLSENELLASGRRAYRGSFIPTWMAKVNIETGAETLYTVTTGVDEDYKDTSNFHMMQGLGAGFVRLSDTVWANAYADGNNFLVGRGGYDVLGSPLGPAMGVWSIGDATARFLLDFPVGHEQRRDPYYTYADGEAQQLPIWKDPDSIGGFWQAGDVGGLAFINHPEVKGVLATYNHGRGILDYRSQTDGGSGAYFLVEEPSLFYSSESGGGDRGDHESDTHLAVYPDGVYGRVGLVYDPDHIAEVSQGMREPWECTAQRFEWPRAGIEWRETKPHTALGGVYWDNERQLLWLVVGMPSVKFLAYEILVDDSRTEEPMLLPEGWAQSAVETPAALPENSACIMTVSPNPFNPTTVITVSGVGISAETKVPFSLKIFDACGRIVAIDGRDRMLRRKSANEYSFELDGASLPSGAYLIQAEIDGKLYTKHSILPK